MLCYIMYLFIYFLFLKSNFEKYPRVKIVVWFYYFTLFTISKMTQMTGIYSSCLIKSKRQFLFLENEMNMEMLDIWQFPPQTVSIKITLIGTTVLNNLDTDSFTKKTFNGSHLCTKHKQLLKKYIWIEQCPVSLNGIWKYLPASYCLM